MSCKHKLIVNTQVKPIKNIMTFSAWSVFKRQQLIEPHLNVFKEETEALELLTLLSWAMPLMVYSTSLLDILLMVVYQKWLHPWRGILTKVSASFHECYTYKVQEEESNDPMIPSISQEPRSSSEEEVK